MAKHGLKLSSKPEAEMQYIPTSSPPLCYVSFVQYLTTVTTSLSVPILEEILGNQLSLSKKNMATMINNTFLFIDTLFSNVHKVLNKENSKMTEGHGPSSGH